MCAYCMSLPVLYAADIPPVEPSREDHDGGVDAPPLDDATHKDGGDGLHDGGDALDDGGGALDNGAGSSQHTLGRDPDWLGGDDARRPASPPPSPSDAHITPEKPLTKKSRGKPKEKPPPMVTKLISEAQLEELYNPNSWPKKICQRYLNFSHTNRNANTGIPVIDHQILENRKRRNGSKKMRPPACCWQNC